jgi:hypothetical protein
MNRQPRHQRQHRAKYTYRSPMRLRRIVRIAGKGFITISLASMLAMLFIVIW